MERALLTNRVPESLPEGIDRLYFGAEFCCWRMPALTEVRRAFDFCRRESVPLTLVTPVLYQSWLPQAHILLEGVRDLFSGADELLISDFGMLGPARQHLPGVTTICGRALSGQKRGPRILDLQLSPAEMDYFRRGSWYSSEAVAFLQEKGIQRVELDNLLQGIAPLPEGLHGSLHLPYALVTSSRNCPFRKPHHDRPCQPACGEVFTLESTQTAIPLLQGGNSQFLRNDRLPEHLDELGVDRLVEHGELPA